MTLGSIMNRYNKITSTPSTGRFVGKKPVKEKGDNYDDLNEDEDMMKIVKMN